VVKLVAKPGSAGSIRLVTLLAIARRRQKQLITMTVAIFLIAAIVVFVQERVYRAYVTMVPSEPLVDPGRLPAINGLLGFGLADAGQMDVFQARTSMNEAFAILNSKLISRRFIETEGLMPVLFASQWDEKAKTWKESSSGDTPTIDDAIEIFERDIRFLSRNRQTGFMRVNIEWSDPELAARWANRLVELADEAIRERDIQEARDSIRFLREQAAAAPLESVRRFIYTLIESYSKTVMVASVKKDYAFAIIDPAVAPRIDEPINMPHSFKLSLAVLFALGCSIVYVTLLAHFEGEGR
jgi:uncharacterized protein involved in exopolysaccharide biosynthesis